MLVELVHTMTSDGVRLDGALGAAEGDGSGASVDGVVLLHGAGGNFYSSLLMETLASVLTPLGVDVVRANTRGHDAVSTAVGRRFGAAFESVDDCRHDVSAWTEFLLARGCRRIGLIGHSLGAVKALYSQAYQPHAAVERVVAMSPPRLSYSAFQHGASAAEFFAAMSRAEELVDQGQGQTLSEISFPLPLLITAAGYVDKYGRAERYNFLKFAELVSCPALYTFGSVELERGGVAFAGLDDAVRHIGGRATARLHVVTIDGADHFYRQRETSLAEQVASWLVSR